MGTSGASKTANDFILDSVGVTLGMGKWRTHGGGASSVRRRPARTRRHLNARNSRQIPLENLK